MEALTIPQQDALNKVVDNLMLRRIPAAVNLAARYYDAQSDTYHDIARIAWLTKQCHTKVAGVEQENLSIEEINKLFDYICKAYDAGR
jgi:hypothetical protein